MEEKYFKKIMSSIIFVVLVVLSFLLIKPILLSIIVGFILAFIFMPLHTWFSKKINSKYISASIMCILLTLVIFLPVWFLTPIIIKQSFDIYLISQKTDFVTPLKNFFPSFFASDDFSAEIGSAIYSFVTKMTNFVTNALSQIILNFPTLLLKFVVVFFTFFYVLIDKDKIILYIKSLLPFSKDVEKKLFDYSKDITSSVIYGQVIIGLLQGVIVGLGLFIFKVPNALFLTLLASLAGVFPIIGTTIVWLPVTIYLFIAGNTFSAAGVGIFGIISNTVDNILRPIFVSKRAKMHPLLILIGMVGGLFLFGIVGFILGPLIIAYILTIIEIYRNKNSPGVFIQNS